MAKVLCLLSTQGYVAIWLWVLFWGVQCQILTPYQDLSPYPSYYSTGGDFTFPVGDTIVYSEGSIMTISWDSSYTSVNLYDVYLHNISVDAVIDGKAQSQVQLATGYTGSSFKWTVSCTPDCDAPFVLHVVNAQGNASDLLGGGFWSIYFWVAPANPTSSTSSSASSSESQISISSATTSQSRSTAATSASATHSGSGGDQGGLSKGATIGVGVGVGVGVALVLIAGALFFWRHHHRKTHHSYNNPSAAVPSDPGASMQWSGMYQSHPPLEMSGGPGHEIPKPVEAPAYRDPYELPTNPDR